MSLQARLAIGLAVLAAAAVSTAAGIAYAATAGRLAAEIDQSLEQGATRLASGGPGAMGPFAGSGLTTPMMTGHGPLGIFGLVVVQYLDAAGEVVSTQGQASLPVEAHDRALARSGGRPWLHTASAGALTYQVLTQPLAGGGAVQLARDDNENQAVLGSLRWRFGLLDAAVVAAAAAAGWLFARRLTRPLRRLAVAADEVATTGRLDVAVDARAGDETGHLAGAFATMLSALSRSRDQQQQLAEDAAHELRTPLTSLRANIDLLRRHRDLPDPTRERVLSDLDGELRGLTGLVDELVELAADRRTEEPRRLVVLDRLAARVAERARSRTGREITLTVAKGPSVVLGREQAIERAVANLVDNAVKFSPSLAPVHLSVTGGRIEVRDHGAGIAAADVSRVFDRFYRSTAARSQPGSGLGLAIVRHVAESHGGDVFADNHPEGGAVVGFELRTQTADEQGPVPCSGNKS